MAAQGAHLPAPPPPPSLASPSTNPQTPLNPADHSSHLTTAATTATDMSAQGSASDIAATTGTPTKAEQPKASYGPSASLPEDAAARAAAASAPPDTSSAPAPELLTTAEPAPTTSVPHATSAPAPEKSAEPSPPISAPDTVGAPSDTAALLPESSADPSTAAEAETVSDRATPELKPAPSPAPPPAPAPDPAPAPALAATSAPAPASAFAVPLVPAPEEQGGPTEDQKEGQAVASGLKQEEEETAAESSAAEGAPEDGAPREGPRVKEEQRGEGEDPTGEGGKEPLFGAWKPGPPGLSIATALAGHAAHSQEHQGPPPPPRFPQMAPSAGKRKRGRPPKSSAFLETPASPVKPPPLRQLSAGDRSSSFAAATALASLLPAAAEAAAAAAAAAAAEGAGAGEVSAPEAGTAPAAPPKRGRGRPRKYPLIKPAPDQRSASVSGGPSPLLEAEDKETALRPRAASPFGGGAKEEGAAGGDYLLGEAASEGPKQEPGASTGGAELGMLEGEREKGGEGGQGEGEGEGGAPEKIEALLAAVEVKRKRGRPRKHPLPPGAPAGMPAAAPKKEKPVGERRKQSPRQAQGQAGSSSPGQALPPRRQLKPPKRFLDEGEQVASESGRRGRPRKAADGAPEAGGARPQAPGAAAAGGAVGRPRGRPRKEPLGGNALGREASRLRRSSSSSEGEQGSGGGGSGPSAKGKGAARSYMSAGAHARQQSAHRGAPGSSWGQSPVRSPMGNPPGTDESEEEAAEVLRAVAGARGGAGSASVKGKRGSATDWGGPEFSDNFPPVRATVKGPRGRPPKAAARASVSPGLGDEGQGVESEEGRERGGAGGAPLADAAEESQARESQESQQQQGRAHKEGLGSIGHPAAVPKKRGRPRKYPLPSLPDSPGGGMEGGGGGGGGSPAPAVSSSPRKSKATAEAGNVPGPQRKRKKGHPQQSPVDM